MIRKRKNRAEAGVNAGSMADIAFLLLIFFLVTTTIASDRGIQVQLPPKQETVPEVEIKPRNIYKILINSADRMLVENKPAQVEDLTEGVKKHVTNNGVDPNLSESPKKAIVLIQTDRGTSYEMYIEVMDEVRKAYAQLRADYLKVSVERYLRIAKKKTPEDEALFDRAKKKYPFQVADAEPTKVGG